MTCGAVCSLEQGLDKEQGAMNTAGLPSLKFVQGSERDARLFIQPGSRGRRVQAVAQPGCRQQKCLAVAISRRHQARDAAQW